MEVNLEPGWKEILEVELESEYFSKLLTQVDEARQKGEVYPPKECVFNAFNLCPFNEVRVVILGQDPYHGVGQAHGLSFSVQSGVRTPPSLQNIYKEIKSDLGIAVPDSGNLEHWATQGVLLLNSTLTVNAGEPNSHQQFGWSEFTDVVIKKISNQKAQVVFMLWGKFAESKTELIDSSKHLILTTTHPSPFSAHRGFLGCKHFSQTNEYLEKQGIKPINW